MLGVSPTLVRALIPKGEPEADLTSLRAITTTGEPWNAGPYDWLNEHAAGGGRIPIVNISGGTEVGACFLSVTPMAPTKPCALGFPALGQAMDVFSPEGTSLREEVGELVCTRAWPGMTRGIWGDDARYLETYWSRFPGVWTHGDWASIDEDGYWSLHGRSDDTLNIAGKRIGPAELESAALDHPAVAEAAAVGIPHEVKGEVAWLFCGLRPGAEGRRGRSQDDRRSRARQGVRAGARVLRQRASEDSQREDRPACRQGQRARRGSRRPLDPGEPRDPGGDRECRLERSSQEVAEESAPESPASSARHGWHVTVTGRTQEQVEDVAREIGGATVVGDVSKREDVERMIAAAEPDRPARRECGRRAVGGLVGDRRRRVVARLRGQRPRRVPHLPARAAGDDRARRRPDRDHGERFVVSPGLDLGGVFREQGGGRPLRRDPRDAGRRARNQGLRDQPRSRARRR